MAAPTTLSAAVRVAERRRCSPADIAEARRIFTGIDGTAPAAEVSDALYEVGYLLGLDEVETENFESAIIWKKLR